MKRWLLLLTFIYLPALASVKVAVTVKPLHDVALAVMEGVGTPSLLVPAGASPHSYALSPSQAQALYQADLIVWVGPGLETFMLAPLSQAKSSAVIMTLIETPGMILYPNLGDEIKEHGPVDPHLWLDIQNLIVYATRMSETLSTLDPPNAKRYQANAKRVVGHLKQLDQTLAKELAPVENAPLMVFHQAYQYFAKRYHLNVVGSVVLRPDMMPSVARVLEIQQTLKSQKVRCIFSEPQFKPAIVERLVHETGVRYGVLDPLGSPTPTGLPGTQALFNNLAHSITACVQ